MKICVHVQSHDELAKALRFGADEIICGHQQYSREGGADEATIAQWSRECRDRQLDFAVDMDRLVEERSFNDMWQAIRRLPAQPRLKDLGLAQACAAAGIAFQLNLDTGNANAGSVGGWAGTWPDLCKKIILNHDIPKGNLFPLLQSMQTPGEMLGLGSILMYYTPRKLLSWQDVMDHDVLLRSPDMGSGEFRLLEHEAGTLLYFNKDLCLLNHAAELAEHGLRYLRFDFRHMTDDAFAALLDVQQHPVNLDALRRSWPRPLLHGYFAANRSDSTFHHLPKRRKLEDQPCVGEILDQDERHWLIRSFSELHEHEHIAFAGTQNMEALPLRGLSNLSGQTLQSLGPGQLGLLDKRGKIQTGSLLYRLVK